VTFNYTITYFGNPRKLLKKRILAALPAPRRNSPGDEILERDI